MRVIEERHIDLYKEAIDSVREQLGRYFYIILPPVQINCPNCKYDPIHNVSTNIYEPDDPYPVGVPGPMPFQGLCPICRGKGTIETVANSKKIKGNITWLVGPKRNIQAWGVEELADIEIRNLPLRYEDEIKKAIHFTVDGKKMYLIKTPVIEGLRDKYKLKIYLQYEKPADG